MPDEGVTFQTTVATPPAGFTVAYDNVGGFAYQRVKLDLGADGVSTSVTGTVPVSGTVSVSGSVDTELPAATALADNMANPTVPQVGSHAMIWDAVGLNWDRQLQPLTDTQLRASAVPVDVSDRAARLVGIVSGGANVFHVDDNAGSLTVDAPVGTPAFARLSDGAAALVGQKTMALSLPVALASDQSVLPAVAEQRASPLAVTVTGIAAAAVTLTLPLVAAQFHYITEIQIVKFATALLTAAATPVLVTTTNLPGSPVFSFSAAASAQGTNEVQQFQPTSPLKSSVAGTATTIVCPATTATIWRVNVFYYAAA